MSAIVPFEALQAMAQSMVKSGLFGVKTADQAVSLMLIAQAEGKHPAIAAQEYHIIQGRPALKADTLLARFQQAGGIVEWCDYTDEKVSARFSHPQSSPKPVLIEWTLAQAKRVGLAGKDNWKNYPRAMLRARVISEGVRTVYPGIAIGIYSVEEVQDMPLAERNMGAAQVVAEPLSGTAIDATLTAVADALSKDALQAIWKEAAEKCRQSGDQDAHKQIKEAVTKRLAELAAQEGTI